MDKIKCDKNFRKLVETIQALRDPETGCPWDKEQTHSSLKEYLIEESYELLDAIDANSSSIAEELGDVLLQVMLHSQIADDDGRFNINTVIETLNHKLISRHPHVFGDKKVQNSTEVIKVWDKSKKDNENKGLLEGIPRSMPGIQKAYAIGKKTERVGFDWETDVDVLEKVNEEVQEYCSAVKDNESKERMNEEFGDLLFTLVQLARKQKIQPEEALQITCTKFLKRFEHMESKATKSLEHLTENERRTLWENAKKEIG